MNLTRQLVSHDVIVVEVNRPTVKPGDATGNPTRQMRRQPPAPR